MSTLAYEDRSHVSLNSTVTMYVEIWVQGELTDPDGDVYWEIANISDYHAAPVVVIAESQDRLATRESLGRFSIEVGPSVSGRSGLYSIAWVFEVGGVERVENTYFEVSTSAPYWDALSADYKALVESVWNRLEDCFDSPDGGPYLSTLYQSQFGRNRVAHLMSVALGKINLRAQPHQTYTLEGPKLFPLGTWGGLLEQMTLVETIKHLMRSYVEQPEVIGSTVARVERRDYLQRWQSILDIETRDLDSMLDHFKMAHMGFSSPSVLVSGGSYGRIGPSRSASGRPRFVTRFIY